MTDGNPPNDRGCRACGKIGVSIINDKSKLKLYVIEKKSSRLTTSICMFAKNYF